MTINRLKAAFDRALRGPRVTTRELEAIEAALRDGGAIAPREAAALRAFAARYGARFDGEARPRLEALLQSLPSGTPTPPALVAPPRTFGPREAPAQRPSAPSRGPKRDEALATFDRLSSSVSSGVLTPAELLQLAAAASRLGIMGEPQAVRAVKLLGALGPADAAAFQALADRARSPLERAWLYKALGAGTPLVVLQPFADEIRGWSDEQLRGTLTLLDATLDDRHRPVVTAHAGGALVVTTGALLRAEADPVYALRVRAGRGVVSTPAEAPPGAVAEPLEEAAAERPAGIIGFAWTLTSPGERSGLTPDAQLDLLVSQLAAGIPTPVLAGDGGITRRHALLAREARGEGDTQRFLLHDPWSGDVLATRAQLREGGAPLGEFDRLAALYLVAPPEL
jgi:hypothetical protein